MFLLLVFLLHRIRTLSRSRAVPPRVRGLVESFLIVIAPKGPSDYMLALRVPSPAASFGTVHFSGLVYMRCNYTFTYVANATNVLTAIAFVGAQNTDHIGAPKQGHISITENDDELIVSYTSGVDTTPSVRFVRFIYLQIG